MRATLFWLAVASAVCVSEATLGADDRPTSLSGRLSRATAARLIDSEDMETRIRGFERLGTMGTAQAVARLTAALGPAGAAKTPLERLVIVRQLDAYRHDPLVQRALVRTLTEGVETRLGPIDEATTVLVRATAATVLARSAAPTGLKALAGALRTVGPAARAAEQALVAHPSPAATAFLARSSSPSVREVRVLSRLGDQRAFSTLRRLVRTAPPPIAAAAAVALTRLGHFETVDLARSWARAEGPRRDAAMEILVLARDPAAPALVEAALESRDRFAEGLSAALELGAPALVGPLAKHLPDADADAQATLLAALSRIGTPEAVDVLAARVRSQGDARAAYALGRVPGPAAWRAIEGLMQESGPSRHLGLRAAAVRRVTLGDVEPDLLATALSGLSAEHPSERAAAASLVAALAPERIATLTESEDPVIVRAAARWLVGNAEAALVAARRLASEEAPALADALAACLAWPEARERVATSALLRLIGRGGAAMPLAALALAERDRPDLADDVLGLLASPNHLVRSQVALGLGLRPDPRALGWIERAYRGEPDATVRLSLIRAAASRPEPARDRLLALADRLDPDHDVATVARLARHGVVLSPPFDRRGTVWAVVGGELGGQAAVMVVLPTGEAVPMMTDPDGIVMTGGLPRGAIVLRVASGAERDHAPARDGEEVPPEESGARERGGADLRGLDPPAR